MQWVLDNWFILLLVVGMVAMHLFGHGHGGHGRGSHRHGGRRDRDADPQSDGSPHGHGTHAPANEPRMPGSGPADPDGKP